MAAPNSTCWTMIHGAAAGSPAERDAFARIYSPVVRAYVSARWRSSVCRDHIDDALQDVFLECFRDGGALEKVESDRPGGFRAYLYGVVRHVALKLEREKYRHREQTLASKGTLEDLAGSEEDLARAFDRAWATALVQEALTTQEQRARDRGPPARERLEILRLRFHESLPIRDIAKLWQTDADRLHEQYSKARLEFKEALLEVISFHNPSASPGETERESVELLALLK